MEQSQLPAEGEKGTQRPQNTKKSFPWRRNPSGGWDRFFQSCDPSVLLRLPGDPEAPGRGAATPNPTPETSQLASKFSFPGRKCLKIPPNTLQPRSHSRWSHSCWAGSIQRSVERPKNSKSKVKIPNSLRGRGSGGSSAFPGWEPEAGKRCGSWKDTSKRCLKREKGPSQPLWKRESIPSSGRGAPSDPQHEGGRGLEASGRAAGGVGTRPDEHKVRE